MPLSAVDIAAANAADALTQNRFTAAKLTGIITAMQAFGMVAICPRCIGSGYIPPAFGVPSCTKCNGAGFVSCAPILFPGP